MRPVTWTTLATELQPWLTARYVPDIAYLQGGWENWIQTDFVSYMNQQGAPNPANMVDIERESPLPYTNGGRADWLVNRNTANAFHPQLVIEIKAQTPVGTRAAFVAGVGGDIAQLATGNLAPAYRNAMRIALAFVIDQTTAQQVETTYNMARIAGTADLFGVWARIVAP